MNRPEAAPLSRGQAFWSGFALLLVACTARLVLVGTARFGGDEIVMFQMAERISRGQEFPMLGASITGGGASLPGPLFYYLMAVPMLLGFRSPEAANAFIALLGGAAVWLYWSALRPWFGERGAAIAAILMACLPWSTLYADRIWPSNTIGFFTAVAFWAACRVRREPDRLGVVALLVSAGVMPQLHLSAPMVWAALLPIFLRSVPRWRWSWAAAGLGCVLALYAPMLLHEFTSHWSNSRAFLSESGGGTSSHWQRLPLWAFRLLTLDLSYHQLSGYWVLRSERELRDFLLHGNGDFTWTPARHALLWLSYAFALGTLGLLLVRRLRRARPAEPPAAIAPAPTAASEERGHPFLRAALFGFAANVLLIGLTHRSLFGHYVQPLLPFYFVAFAELGRASLGWGRGRFGLYGVVTALCLGGIDSALWVSRRLDARNGLSTMRAVLAAIQADRPGLREGKLEFDYRSMNWGFNVLLAGDPQNRLKFDKTGPVYRLKLREAAAPAGGRLVAQTGPIAVWAMP